MIKWRDIFYFAKGERQALSFLLLLIVFAFLILHFTNKKHLSPSTNPVTTIITDTIRFAKRTDTVPDVKNINPTMPEKIVTKKKKHTTNPASFQKQEKYPEGTIVELNGADTTTLKKIPGIGSSFARRITKYRELLGGFHHIEQLAEVYGIDEERYSHFQKWFIIDTTYIRPIPVNQASFKEILRHPYINLEQTKVIDRIKKQKGRINSWNDLRLFEEFPPEMQKKMEPYITFK